MMHLFYEVSHECSKITTKKYSTSFASAIKLLHKDLRTPIYNVYGFVRFADEIVDTFHGYDQAMLLQQFKTETYEAIEEGHQSESNIYTVFNKQLTIMALRFIW